MKANSQCSFYITISGHITELFCQNSFNCILNLVNFIRCELYFIKLKYNFFVVWSSPYTTKSGHLLFPPAQLPYLLYEVPSRAPSSLLSSDGAQKEQDPLPVVGMGPQPSQLVNHIPLIADWFRDGHMIQVGPMRALP